ncbi:hypothetical protein H9L39_20398 [Fusarium oxysporum f. sp. albedinis]|nr:hypothetical protein H9L39_20398 [Fusarium oxysporum f. sp. albedinis]
MRCDTDPQQKLQIVAEMRYSTYRACDVVTTRRGDAAKSTDASATKASNSSPYTMAIAVQ